MTDEVVTARCRQCGDEIQARHGDGMVGCRCGAIRIDHIGAGRYRRFGDPDNFLPPAPRATPDMDMPRNSAPTSPEKVELQFCACNVRPLSDQTTSSEPIIPLTREEADRLLGRT